jgi:hypothetical protein
LCRGGGRRGACTRARPASRAEALAALGAALEDTNRAVRLAAGLALYAAGAWRERVLAALIDEALIGRRDDSETYALFSLRPLPAAALDRIWAEARPQARGQPARSTAVGLFIGVARDDPSQSARIGRASHGPLLAALEIGSKSARCTVLDALSVHCARAAKQPPEHWRAELDDLVRAAVTRSLEDREPRIQRKALRLLPFVYRAGPSPEMVGRLVGVLDARPDRTCFAAISLLASIGPPAAPAVPALLRLLRGTYPGKGDLHAKPAPPPILRRRVPFALGSIGPQAGAAIPALIELLADPCAAVRRNAAWALGRVALEETPEPPSPQKHPL